jgi:hypothetical protein
MMWRLSRSLSTDVIAVRGYEHEQRLGDEFIDRLLGIFFHLFEVANDVRRQCDSQLSGNDLFGFSFSSHGVKDGNALVAEVKRMFRVWNDG